MINFDHDYTAGWNCTYCGMFVPHNHYHVCAGSAPLAPIAPVVMNRDAEIIDLLKRIVELLEYSQGIIQLGEQG